MEKRVIDDFDVILLDMGNTFMFNIDRFDEDQDYHATYRQLGGQLLGAEDVRAHITDVFGRMLSAARDPTRYDDFGHVRRFLRTSRTLPILSPRECDLIVEVFARHEVRRVPGPYAEALHRLRRSHPLGIVSNVWSPSHIFETELDRVGIRDLFTTRIWSSDCLSIKPSPRLFQKALDAFGVAAARVLYVGDNPMRDIGGAKAMGMGTVWVENETRPLNPENPAPDHIVSDLTQLPESIALEKDCQHRSQ